MGISIDDLSDSDGHEVSFVHDFCISMLLCLLVIQEG